MNLLIVDDEPTNLKLLRAQLEAEDHVVFAAGDGVDALALLQRQPVDAIISDILMPRLDGYRLCHEIRQQEGLKETPFIFYTATYTSPGDEQLAFDVGADKYLRKPAPMEAIIDALREVTGAKTGPRPPAKRALPEAELMKEYSAVLVHKLEEQNAELRDRTADLEREITERKRAEAALREAHDRMAMTVTTAPGIICSLRLRPDGSMCFPFGGERLAENYGILSGRLAEDAAPFFALIHPDDLAGLQASFAESARLLRPFHQEWRIMRHPVRDEVWIEAHSIPQREPDGGTIWHGVATDITERRLAEATLREQLDELRRWQAVMLGREERNMTLKREVNELCRRLGEPARYPSQAVEGDEGRATSD